MLGAGRGLGAPGGTLNRGKWSQAEALVNGGSSLYPLSRQKLRVQQEGHQLDLRNNFFRARLGCEAKED